MSRHLWIAVALTLPRRAPTREPFAISWHVNPYQVWDPRPKPHILGLRPWPTIVVPDVEAADWGIHRRWM